MRLEQWRLIARMTPARPVSGWWPGLEPIARCCSAALGLIVGIAGAVPIANAIPSPELIVGSIGSLSQLGALVWALLGGGAAFAAVRTGSKREARSRTMTWALGGAMVVAMVLAGLNYLQWQSAKQAHWERLSATLTRPSRLPGQPRHDGSLKELSPREQSTHPLGLTTAEAERVVSDPGDHGYVMLDIREPAEVEMGTFAAAKAVRYPDLIANGFDFAGRKALLICHNGNRSSETCQALAARGVDCRFVVGGLERWITEGRSAGGFYRNSLAETRAIPAYPNNRRLLDTNEARQLIEAEGAVVVDVRYPGEFAAGHLPGAINLPMRRMTSAALEEAIGALALRPVVVACYERRSCFFGELLGLTLTRAGRDFRGRYTLPWEYTPTVAVPAHVQELLARRSQGSYERATNWLGELIHQLARSWGFLSVLIGLAVLSRAVVLPFAVKAERDQLLAAQIEGEVAALKARLSDDSVRRARALRALYDRHGMTPVRNLLALMALPILAMASTAVGKAAALGGYEWAMIGRLDQPDASLVLPVVCGLAMALYVDWVLTRSGRQQVLCWLIVAPVMAVLMAMLPGAIGLYVLVSLVLIFAQRWVVVQVVGAKRKRRRRPGRGTVRALGLVDLADAEHVAGIGGKARRLASMLGAGVAVPRGLVLTPQFTALWQATPPDRRHRLERRIARAASGGPFAVRSTAEGEDGAQASHAGVFATVTDVPADRLGAAIETVLGSYTSHRMESYVFTGGAMRGGVIVQQMVAAEYAGVLFTRAPDAAGLALVEMVEGAGEALVSGERSPTTHRFGRRSGQAIAGAEPPIDLAPLLDTGRRLEVLFGCPQDIEWVYAGGRFLIVQARDITTGVHGVSEAGLEEWEAALCLVDAGNGRDPVLVRDAMAELLPTPTPVSASLIEALYAAGGSVDLACRRLGLAYRVAEAPAPLFPVVFGRLYVNQVEQQARAPRLAGWQVRGVLKRAKGIEARFREEVAPALLEAGARARAIDFEALETPLLLTMVRELVDRFIGEHHVEAEIVNILADLCLQEARKALEAAGLDVGGHLAPSGGSLLQLGVEAAMAGEGQRRQLALERALGHRSRLDYELAEARFSEDQEALAAFVAGFEIGAAGIADGGPDGQMPADVAEIVALAGRLQTLKEDAKHVVLGDLAAIRQALLVVGGRFGLGVGIFHLTLDEIRGLDGGRVAEMAARAEARAERRQSMLEVRALPRELSVASVEVASWPGGRSIQGAAGGIAGTRVAGSRVAGGRAYVVAERDAERGAHLLDFAAGDILVTQAVHPAWLAEVLRSGGVVCEVGGGSATWRSWRGSAISRWWWVVRDGIGSRMGR